MKEKPFKAIAVDRVSETCGTRVQVGDEEAVVFRVGNGFSAVRNRCPHQQHQRLHEGSFDGAIVTCPMHGWKFDVRSGESLSGEGRLTVWPVWVEEGWVVVDCREE